MNGDIELKCADDIKLEHHAVIEASAGTGKTRMVEQLVTRLLCKNLASLDEILLVTYTEKAAGDMKERVRAAIQRRLHDSSEDAPPLRAALDNFDKASIQTIHGFCSRLLGQYAFENRQAFQLAQADGRDLARKLLREQQRARWPAEYGELLEQILELSGYPELRDGESAWEKKVLGLLNSFRPSCNALLLPRPLPDIKAALEACIKRMDDAVAELKTLVGEIDPGDWTQNPLYVLYGKLNIHGGKRTARQDKVITPLLKFLHGWNQSHALLLFSALIDACGDYTPFKEENTFALLLEGWTKAGDNRQACPNLERIVTILEGLRKAIDLRPLRQQLAARTVERLHEDLEAYKQEHGLIDFDDMLNRVDQALAGGGGGAQSLRETLRRRFKFCIVDEFQDTDSVQWRIFQAIFTGSPAQKLIVIGDPKQAIYGFRGADVRTYIDARETLCNGDKAVLYSLKTNWRSHPGLIGALDHVFSKGEWFSGHSKEEIQYASVHPPEDDKLRRAKLYEDRSGRAALTIVNVAAARTLSAALHMSINFIAEEIKRLLSGGSRLVFQLNNRAERLCESHICVLVRAKREAEWVEEALRGKKIACTYYKKPGIWQSAEALHLGCLFKAIAEQGDFQAFKKALLTRFFRVPLEELSRYEDLPPAHPVKLLFETWRELCGKRNWAQLFQSVLEDTGVLCHEIQTADGERRVANYRHVLQALEELAYAENLDVTGISEALEELRRNENMPEDVNLHRLESESPKVQIMTIHASKGLEFPIVFLAGHFGKNQAGRCYKFHDAEKRVVYDLARASENEAPHLAEDDDEDRRLYYVALTRAIYKLYAPSYTPPQKEAHRSGPQITILSKALELSAPAAKFPRWVRVVSYNGGAAQGEPGLSPQLDAAPAAPEVAVSTPIALPPDLFPRWSFDFRNRRIEVSSFSSLHRRGLLRAAGGPEAMAGETPALPGYAARPLRADDDKPGERAAERLPRGPAIGELLHYLLEKLDYAAVAAAKDYAALLKPSSPCRALIDQCLSDQAALPFPFTSALRGAGASAAERWREQIAELLWKALRTPLKAAGSPIAALAPSERLHELEFYYPLTPPPNPSHKGRGEQARGFIDLVFRRNGRYFIADWKSNVLPEYSPNAIAADIRERSYDLQYRLYAVALARWLRRVMGPEFDFTAHVGGVYYLYLRGMNGVDESSGVFFHPLSSLDEILEYEKAIMEQAEQRP